MTTPISRDLKISIHALREEGDAMKTSTFNRIFEFLSTPSARRATAGALLFIKNLQNFYPRPPRGGRQCTDGKLVIFDQFLSTPSARRATGDPGKVAGLTFISIHALREEGDSQTWANRPF